MKNLFYLLFASCIVAVSIQAKSKFEYYGDIMQTLSLFTFSYELISGYKNDKDFTGAKEQAYGAISTLAATYAIKYSFVGISHSDKNLAHISRRPNNDSFDGTPSGHTATTFSAVGFTHKRYGKS